MNHPFFLIHLHGLDITLHMQSILFCDSSVLINSTKLQKYDLVPVFFGK